MWRALNPGQQALLVLVCLRKGEPFAEVGAGFAARIWNVLAALHDAGLIALADKGLPRLRRNGERVITRTWAETSHSPRRTKPTPTSPRHAASTQRTTQDDECPSIHCPTEVSKMELIALLQAVKPRLRRRCEFDDVGLAWADFA